MQNVTLNNGVEMPILGFGVYQVPPEDTQRVVEDALEVGYRSLDTAAAYFNEDAVGRAIKASGLPRDELFITTKLWISDAGDEGARVGFERSLGKLGLDHLDLYLIHQPFGDTYGTMEKLLAEGLTRAIGVSNFYPDRLVDLVEHNEVVPAINQIETHPFFQRADYQELLASLGVRIESWGPFAEGRNNLFTDPVLSEIARAHDATVGQVVLRWLVQRGVVVIPKSVRRERMEENFAAADLELTDADVAAIAALDTGASLFIDHTDPEAVRMLSGMAITD